MENFFKRLSKAAFTFAAAAAAGIACVFSVSAESYTQKTITVDYNYQTVDSFEGIDSQYVLFNSDTGYYCCANYVSRFYAENFGVTVYNINIIDDKPSVYIYGKNAELRTVSTPQPGDIMQTKDYTHVAIVKECKNGKAVLIEQNYKWTKSGVTYTVVNRTVDVNDYYFYRLYINGAEQSICGDISAPVITSMKSSSVSAEGYTVSANIYDDRSVEKVIVSTYTKSSGNSDIRQETFVKPAANFSYTVDTADFGGKSDTYVTTFYAYDAAGNVSSKTVETYVEGTYISDVEGLKTESVSASSVKLSWSEVSGAEGYIVYRLDPSAGSSKKVGTVSACSFTDKNLKGASNYVYEVTAYKTVGGKTCESETGAQLSVYTNPDKAICDAVSEESGSISVSWDEIYGADGYVVYISETGVTGEFTKAARLTGGKTTSCTLEDCGSYCLRFVKVRAYKIVGGNCMYGAFSPVKMVMIA